MSVAVGNTTKEINLLGESGDTLSTFDVLQQIAEYWDEMTNAQQTAIASSLAGKTRFDVFAATMNGFEDAIDASTTALNSQGSAWEENDKRAESLTA